MKKHIPFLYICILSILATGCKEIVTPSKTENTYPSIFPDYTEVTIPATIAPLNFMVKGNHSKIDAVIKGNRSGIIHVQDKKNVLIPPKAWKQLLAENTGGEISITVSVKQAGKWTQYADFKIYISEQPIDHGLAYRRIAPGYEVYSKMGIYQRDLSSLCETPIIENTLITGSCVNCHSFCAGNPKQMSLHLRGEHGATILMDNKKTDLLNTKTEQTIASCVYPYWHPSGKYIAYSVNQTQQVFHEIKDKRIEVVDTESDIVVFHTETNELLSCTQLKSETSFETFPAFSPDGKKLYFCSAESRPIPEEYNKVQYSLCSIPFDPENGTFGQEVDTLIFAGKWNKSISFPRPSYDGKHLMYTLSDYGNFSIWHKESDLWLFDINTRETHKIMEVSSDEADSYHSWSSNSRWFVFSSRRIDGLYTHPYIASIDNEGKVTKPFLLPQENPAYYQTSLYSFNIPEFITGPVEMNIREVEKKALSKERKQMKYKKQFTNLRKPIKQKYNTHGTTTIK